jgi:peptide chain release factor 3
MNPTMNPTMQDTVTSTTDQTDARAINDVTREAARRRTFGVISHPDAGKSTLTEALALHAQVITEAGPCTARPDAAAPSRLDGDGEGAWHLDHVGRAAVRVRRPRDQPGRHPGHSDFSEDTYRVLSAVDCAVMLIDAAKGLEPQTSSCSGSARRAASR